MQQGRVRLHHDAVEVYDDVLGNAGSPSVGLDRLLDDRGLHPGGLLQDPELPQIDALARELPGGLGQGDGLRAVELAAAPRDDDLETLQLDQRRLAKPRLRHHLTAGHEPLAP